MAHIPSQEKTVIARAEQAASMAGRYGSDAPLMPTKTECSFPGT
ncbi:hypothetical protein [Rhodococcus sp. 1168]|nr:hypothetical protein [Rhodococcus sp. 1168]